MDWKTIFGQVFEYLQKTSFRRFLSFLVVIGGTLLGLSWVDLIAILANKIPGDHDQGYIAAVAQITGLVLIVLGVGGHVWLYIHSIRVHERQLATKLIGRLSVLADGFKDPNVVRDAGYFNNEIAECQDAAKKYLDVAPKSFAANRVIAAIANPKFDAGKKAPYIDVSLQDLDVLTASLRERYGIK